MDFQVIALLFFLIAFPAVAQVKGIPNNEKIDQVNVICSLDEACENVRERLRSLKGIPSNQEAIKQSLKNVFATSEVEALSFELKQGRNGGELFIYVQNLPLVRGLSFEGGDTFDFLKIKSLLSIREGEYFQQAQIEESRNTIKKILEESGHLTPKISFDLKKHGGVVDVLITVDPGDVTIIKDVIVMSMNVETKNLIEQKLSYLVSGPWSGYEFNLRLGQINDAFIREGYLFSKIQLIDYAWDKNENIIVPRVEAFLGKKFLFSFHGNTIFSRQELIKSFQDVVMKSVNSLDVSSLENSLLNLYRSKGHYNVKLTSKVRTIRLRSGKEETTFFFIFDEGTKMPVTELQFEGNQHLPTDFLNNFVEQEASVLASRELYDEAFYADLPNKLKRLYWSQGFLFVNIVGPNLRFSKNQKNVEVNYRISEGNRTWVEKIELLGLSEELKQKVLNRINNKIGAPFNPEILSLDQELVVQELQANGYYYATIKNLNEDSFLTYSNGFSRATILMDINLGEPIRLDRILIVGNVKTQNYIIEREIELKQGDLITPKELEKIRDALSSLALFSSIKIVPLEDTDKDGLINLLISLKERNFGTFEITPGFRTDLGVKLGVGGAYNNLWGTNRTLSIKSQVNQRTNLDTLDAPRAAQDKKMVEHSNQFSYNEPYLFGLPLSFGAGFNSARRRFRSFDANIVRSNATISKIFNKVFSSSLRYQFEAITQENATNPLKDEGSFTIGGLTPSLTADFRNNRINPQKGSFFNLSCEIANPYLLSQKNDVLEVNFFKLVSRNRFYVPIPHGVFALSYSLGYQQNLARDFKKDSGGNVIEERTGRIPSIKVFRLNGIDVVRGFADNEINMLDNGKDIQDVIVDNGAYFTNLKIEPRFLLDDNFMLGIFLDGGKIYLNSFDPLSLRTSVGLSFKYLTPVGSLDFDFGVKLHRRRQPDGDLESPSRIHLSIGFF